MSEGRRDYNLRTKQQNTENRNKDNLQDMALNTRGASGGAIVSDTANRQDSADSSLEETRVSPGTAENAAVIPPQLADFMGEIRASLKQMNSKLDKVIDEMVTVKNDLVNTKKDVSDLKTNLTFTSDKLKDLEEGTLPNLRESIERKISELEEKILLSEIHDRKQNLLVYGVPYKSNENVYEIVRDLFGHFMNISKEEAARIPLVNVHRLGAPARREEAMASGSQPQPPAIIIRFIRMIDRERCLNGFERRPRPRPERVDPTSVEASSTLVLGKVTIRTDLPPKMKKERGRLAAIAYTIRKNNHLSTRIKVAGIKVILQTRKPSRNGGPPDKWSDWSG